MFTIHCTQKLLRRLPEAPRAVASAPVHAPTTRLGDYHANVVLVERRPIALLASERTLLPVLLPVAPASTFGERVAPAVAEMLRALGVAAPAIVEEVEQMAEVTLGPTTNRQVVGTITDFARMLPSYVEGGADLRAAALWLARAPCRPIGMESPDRLTQKLVGSSGA